MNKPISQAVLNLQEVAIDGMMQDLWVEMDVAGGLENIGEKSLNRMVEVVQRAIDFVYGPDGLSTEKDKLEFLAISQRAFMISWSEAKIYYGKFEKDMTIPTDQLLDLQCKMFSLKLWKVLCKSKEITSRADEDRASAIDAMGFGSQLGESILSAEMSKFEQEFGVEIEKFLESDIELKDLAYYCKNRIMENEFNLTFTEQDVIAFKAFAEGVLANYIIGYGLEEDFNVSEVLIEFRGLMNQDEMSRNRRLLEHLEDEDI